MRAELEEHLSGAEQAGELESAMKRLGDPRGAGRDFTSGYALTPSPLLRRFFAAGIDIAIFIALIGSGLATGRWRGTRRDEALFPEDLAVDLAGETWYLTSITALGVSLLVLGGLWLLVILPLLEWRVGRTLGKAALGLRVLAEDGTAPSFAQVIVRRLTLVFSGPLQLFDWGFVFFNARGQRAFDILAKTLVVVEDNPDTGALAPAASH